MFLEGLSLDYLQFGAMDYMQLECVFWFSFIWKDWSSCALRLLHNVSWSNLPLSWKEQGGSCTKQALRGISPPCKPKYRSISDPTSYSKRRDLNGLYWLTLNQPNFPTGKWKEPDFLILTGFKDSVDFGLIVIKNILLSTIQEFHLVHCNRQQLYEARWKQEIASKTWKIGMLLPDVSTDPCVPSVHKSWGYERQQDSNPEYLVCF